MNPKNWPNRKKWTATVIMAVYAFLAPFASSILVSLSLSNPAHYQAPAIGQISEEFDETNITILALLVSIFVLAFAIGPLIAGPASEIAGRFALPINANTDSIEPSFCIYRWACFSSLVLLALWHKTPLNLQYFASFRDWAEALRLPSVQVCLLTC